MMGFKLPRRFLRGSVARLLLSIFALALGVALVCAIDLVNGAVFRAFVDVIDSAAGRAALQVATEGSGLFPERVAGSIEGTEGVELVVPVITATAVTTSKPTEVLTVHAFDFLNREAARVYEADGDEALDEPLVFLNTPNAVLVTNAFAERRGLKIDDELLLDTSQGRRRFVVRGLLEPKGIGRAYGGNLLVQDLYQAQEVFARQGLINRIDVVVDRDANVETVRAAIAARLKAEGHDGLRVEAPSQRKADLHAVMRSMRQLLSALSLVALAAAFMIAFNRISTLFEERSWQLGILRTIGLRQRRIRWELIKESFLLGAAGTVLGVLAGFALGRAILPVITTMMALNYRTVAPEAAITVQPTSLLIAALLGVGTAITAALLPAWRVSRSTIIETLRGRGVEQPTSLRSTRIGGAMLAVSLVVCIGLQSWTQRAVWGLVATLLIVVGTKVAALPLLRLTRPALLAAGERFGTTWRFVARNLTRNERRSALIVAMVAIGLGSVLWLGTIAKSFEATAVGVFEQSMQADLVVSSAHIGAGSLEQPIDERLGGSLLEIEGVTSIVGVRLADWQYAGGPIVLDAFDPEYFRSSEYGSWPLHGRHGPDAWEEVAQGKAVVVSSNFVRNLGLDVGTEIELETPNGPLPLRIAGVTTDFASPRGTLELSRELYRAHWNDPMVTRFFVDVSPGHSTAKVRDVIVERLGPQHALRIISSGELVEYWASQVRRAFLGVYVLTVVILLVVVFGIADNFGANVTERTRELGMLRALGARRRRVWWMVTFEALVLSTLGALLALAQGFATAGLWVETTLPHLLGWVIELTLPLALVLGVLFLGIASCEIASLLPARRAARLDPAVALRWE